MELRAPSRVNTAGPSLPSAKWMAAGGGVCALPTKALHAPFACGRSWISTAARARPLGRPSNSVVHRWHQLVLGSVDQSTQSVLVWTGCEAPKISPWRLPIATMRAVSAPLGGGVICGARSERCVNRCLCRAYSPSLGGDGRALCDVPSTAVSGEATGGSVDTKSTIVPRLIVVQKSVFTP